jgi:hypothetical protein
VCCCPPWLLLLLPKLLALLQSTEVLCWGAGSTRTTVQLCCKGQNQDGDSKGKYIEMVWSGTHSMLS